MFNLNIRAAIQSLSDGANSNPTVGSPQMANPNKDAPDGTQNPSKSTPQQMKGMLSQSKSQNNNIGARQDTTPLTYSDQEVELTGTAIPEKEIPKVEERKGFKQNLMDAITSRFTGQSNIDKANSQKGNGGPDTGLKEEGGKRPTAPTMHNPPSKTSPNPKVVPNLPPNPTYPHPKVPQGKFPKVNIPRVKRPS